MLIQWQRERDSRPQQVVRERGMPARESHSPCDLFMVCEPTAGRELCLSLMILMIHVQ